MDAASETVLVFETSDQFQLAMAKGLLEGGGVPFIAVGQIATLVQDVDPFLRKRIRLHVPRNREAEAQELLEQLLHPVPGASGV